MDELAAAHSAEQAAAAEQRERADNLQTQLSTALAEATAAVERASATETAMRDKVQRLDRLEGEPGYQLLQFRSALHELCPVAGCKRVGVAESVASMRLQLLYEHSEPLRH